MIERYTRAEMGNIWTAENRFARMLDVELAVIRAQAEMGIVPRSAAKSVVAKAKFSVKRILELERTTKHDVIAFVSAVAESVGKEGRYLHYGLTSSDVLDTAMSLQIRDAGLVLSGSLKHLDKALRGLIKKQKATLCAGRTHGMHAEPIGFAWKLSGFLAELKRNEVRLSRAFQQLQVCKLSGAVGTYSSISPELESKVAKKLGLTIETLATQVVPRDRHAELLCALAIYAGGLERLALELRHLQRSEVGEVAEGFTRGQKGSSAMPHKKNPISAENLTGLARLIRSYAGAALENISLWHERDISHSSVERVIFPDALILADYATHRMAQLVMDLDVYPRRMKENMELSRGTLFSSQVLLALVDKGMQREEAYAHVQRLSHTLGRGDHLKTRILQDPELKKWLKAKDLAKIFSGEIAFRYQREVLARVLGAGRTK